MRRWAMWITRKDHGSPPAPVAESWRRIEAWLGEHLPDVKSSLRPSVPDADLAKFEETPGRPLPDDVRESWKLHDGQKEGRGNPPGLLRPAAPRSGEHEHDG